MTPSAKCWCGTLQLDDAQFDGQAFLQKLLDDKLISYAVAQIEQGTHYHLQFYVQIPKRVTLGTMKKINGSAHWEIARGTPDDNKKYCTKEDTRIAGPWEVGEPTGAGRRTDLEAAAAMVTQGETLLEIARQMPEVYVRYHSGLKALKLILEEKPPRKFGPEGPEVWIFWGPAGTGKSRRAHETWPDAYRKIVNGKWWDGYSGQETVIFDDFKGSSMSLHDFQTVIDRYPTRVEKKGGSIELSAIRYVFTSNRNPYEWYSAEADPHKSVERRITEFCANHGRLVHMLGQWTGVTEVVPEVGGNTYTPTPGMFSVDNFLNVE